jgi:hypothetical protein
VARVFLFFCYRGAGMGSYRTISSVVALTVALTVALVSASPGWAAAQGGMGRGGGGRGGYGRGASALQRAPGIDIPEIVNPVNLLVEHRQDLALSDTQFTRVIAIKRTLDSTNSPLMRKLDSVQRLFKNGPVFSDGSAERRDSLTEAHSLVQQVSQSVRENNATGRDQAYGLLSSKQLDQAHSLEAAAEQKIQDARKNSGSGRGGRSPSG